MRSPRMLLVVPAAAALAACGSARDVSLPSAAECTVLPTGAVCPSGPAAPTYVTFAKTFFDTYCIRCHSSTLTTPAERHFADPTVNLDTLEGARAVDRCRIDLMAGSGPTGTNRTMPFEGFVLNPPLLVPSDGERAQLSQWLACGMP